MLLFNTFEFAIFFIIVYGIYIILNHKFQNRMLLIASYIFYASWDWRFLSLILISTILDYICGIHIFKSHNLKRKKFFVFLSVLGNLSILGFFKYFNFFSASLQNLMSHFGITLQPHLLNIILPIGISFYTFQTMSYTLDIYRGEVKPTKNVLDFALYVAFFPQLVAGPIERAKNFLPQILNPRKLTLNMFYEGCYLIFWGIVMKIFIADNLAKIVDFMFSSNAPYNGGNVLIALYAFAFQIFCDFAGYSNIARGLGKCMGFNLMENFRLPYFAKNPHEFWQRWHISLSTWLRDYLYISLGGDRKGPINTYRNLAITMILCGVWHGAAFTFIIWGAFHGIILIIHRLLKSFFEKMHLSLSIINKKIIFYVQILFFFHVVCLGWLIFRAQSVQQIFEMLHGLFFNFKIVPGFNLRTELLNTLFYISPLIFVQSLQFYKKDMMAVLKLNILIKALFFVICFYLIIIWGVKSGQEFIYFQF